MDTLQVRDTRKPKPDASAEPVPGLPEPLPEGERILWQGRPGAWALARDALAVRWVLGWFALLAAWRGVATLADQPAAEAARIAGLYLATGALAALILVACAWVMARATLYTITDARVCLRIGAALRLYAQMPFGRVASADLALRRDGTGTIALAPEGRSPLSYLVLWPHCRPWHAGRPKPALRAIPDAAAVAGILARAAGGAVPATVEPAAEPAAVTPPHAIAAE